MSHIFLVILLHVAAVHCTGVYVPKLQVKQLCFYQNSLLIFSSECKRFKKTYLESSILLGLEAMEQDCGYGLCIFQEPHVLPLAFSPSSRPKTLLCKAPGSLRPNLAFLRVASL